MSRYDQPSSYRSVVPWPVYLGLQNRWKQGLFECDYDWVKRLALLLTSAPNQAAVSDLMPLAGSAFKDELEAKVASKDWGAGAVKRDELMDGLGRVAERQTHTGGGKNTPASQITLPHSQNALGITGANAAQRCKDLVDRLIQATSVDTPDNGSVFWNGIDQRALVLHIEKWNKETPGTFGQLEATTDVRHVDGLFKWDGSDTGKNLQRYFAGVSENLGDRARGRMTAAVLWGFRDTSILTYAELPRILYNMADALDNGREPAVTDVSIVVIDALNSNGNVNIVNNSDILELPVWTPKAGKRGYAKDECELTGVKLKHFVNTTGDWTGRPTVPTSQALLDYLASRPNTASPAALRIQKDAKSLVRASNLF